MSSTQQSKTPILFGSFGTKLKLQERDDSGCSSMVGEVEEQSLPCWNKINMMIFLNLGVPLIRKRKVFIVI